jgi:hypothetical protein
MANQKAHYSCSFNHLISLMYSFFLSVGIAKFFLFMEVHSSKSSCLPSQKPPVNSFPDLTTWMRTIASLCLLLMGDLLAQV